MTGRKSLLPIPKRDKKQREKRKEKNLKTGFKVAHKDEEKKLNY